MNEKLLQYLWNFKIFNSFDFKDVDGNDVEILDFGRWNFDSGPDFLFGKIKSKKTRKPSRKNNTRRFFFKNSLNEVALDKYFDL